MKKIFVAMAALATLVACSTDEIVSVNQEAIGFDNAFINNSVRSVVDPSYKYDSKMFADFAVYGFVSADNQAPAAIFDGTQVSGPDWTYEGTQYWINGARYNFNAVAPYNDGWTKTEAGIDSVKLSFTNDGETDLLFATNNYGIYSYNENQPVGKVGFNFRHVLSKVKFSFVNNYNATNSFLRVSNIKIENAYTTANATLKANTTAWEGHAGDNLELVFGNANTTAQDTAAQKFAYNPESEVESHNELLLIPGAVPSFEKKVGEVVTGYKVTFTVEVLVGEDVIKTYSHVVAANFTPVAGYTYDLKAELSHENLDPEHAQEPIEFTVTGIGGWDTDHNDDGEDNDETNI